MKLSIVGTSEITEKILDAVKLCPNIELDAVCSRQESRGKLFINKYGFRRHISTVEELARTGTDAVYIASPNNCHYSQAKILIESGHHILLEKPFTSNSQEMNELINLAKSKNVVLMEAVVTPTLPNFIKLKKMLENENEITHVSLAFAKVTSKLDNFLRGETVSSLSLERSGGSLMDLGLYGVWFTVALWGKPNKINHHSVVKLPSNVDGKGTLVLSYDNFDVEIKHSKISNDGTDAHIHTKTKEIIAHFFPATSKIITIDNSNAHIMKDESVLDEYVVYYHEILEFVTCVREGRESSITSLDNTQIVMGIIDEARRQANIVFSSDI